MNYVPAIGRILLKHVHRAASVDEDDEDDENNVPDVINCPSEENTVEVCFIKQPQPVDYSFYPLAQKQECAETSLLNHAGLIQAQNVCEGYPECAEILE